MGLAGVDSLGAKRDGNGGYAQATYVIPTGTKLGVAYGETNLDKTRNDGAGAALMDSTERVTVGAYHPLTKSLNLVAEYTNYEVKSHGSMKTKFDSYSLGAILFF